MKKKLKIIGLVLIGIVILVIGGSFIWIQTSSYDASGTAETAITTAVDEDSYYYFEGAGENHEDLPAIIYFPGALVDSASYGIWADKIADASYDVYLLKVPFSLAVIDGNAPEEIIEAHPSQRFVIGGHSLGGVMASRYVAEHPQDTAGLLLMGSYPDEKGSIADTQLPVLSLTASNDEVLDWDNYQASKDYLPASTDYEEIAGGNHGGFGSYGDQSGDGTATISNEEQQEQIASLVITWLSANFD